MLPAGTATQLVVTGAPPSSLTAGSPFGLVVKAEDTFGNVISSYQGSVTLSDDQNDLAGTLIVPVSNGVATFSGLTIDQAWAGETLSLSAPNLDGVSAGMVSVSPGPVAQLAVSASDLRRSSRACRSMLRFWPRTSLETLSRIIAVRSLSRSARIRRAGRLSARSRRTPPRSAASFSGLTIAQAGLGYTLKATGSGGLSGVGSAFDATNDQLVFTSQPPGTVTAGSPFSLTVAAENLRPASSDKSFSGLGHDSTPPSLGQDLLGTTTVQAANGVATFTGIELAQAHFGRRHAHGPECQPAGGTVEHDRRQPGRGGEASGRRSAALERHDRGALFQVLVAAEDAQGNVVTSFGGKITLALGTHSGSTSLGGTTSVTAACGRGDL